MNKKGFLLLDSLVGVGVSMSICLICVSSFKMLSIYDDTVEVCLKRENERYEEIFSKLGYCEKCLIETPEEDLYPLELS